MAGRQSGADYTETQIDDGSRYDGDYDDGPSRLRGEAGRQARNDRALRKHPHELGSAGRQNDGETVLHVSGSYRARNQFQTDTRVSTAESAPSRGNDAKAELSALRR